ncbi:MAG: glycerophosphodiester phosphodiesterase [Hyphomicrobiales bacterium]
MKPLSFLLLSFIIFMTYSCKNSQNSTAYKPVYFNNSDRMLVVGHRGSPDIAPENTLSSEKIAFKENADMVECDVWLTKDKRIMVMHDSTTYRTSGENWSMELTPSDSLKLLDVGKFKGPDYYDERIPYLTELIENIPQNKHLVIELKSENVIVPYLSKLIDSLDVANKVVFISFHKKAAGDIKKAVPNAPSFLLIDSLPQKQVLDLIDTAKAYNLDGVDIQHDVINQAVMDKAIEYNYPVFTWTVDSVNEAKRLQKLGVAGLTTNRPGVMVQELYPDKAPATK